MTNVLLIGNGAREHALAEALVKSSKLYSFMAANNPGISSLSEKIKISSLNDFDALKAFVNEVQPDFAVIGPEAPLDMGVVDFLEELKVPSVGPHRVLARLETSKAFTRDVMAKYSVPGAPRFKVFEDLTEAKEFIEELEGFVIKPDGLTGGKGVKVQGDHLDTVEEAIDYCKDVLKDHQSVIVEEKLIGEEFSLQCITDGKTVKITPPAQDHKRAFVDDKGPNTGGMGSYSCEDHLLPFITDEHVQQAREITELMAEALYKETGVRYKGIMYGGFIVTKNGVKLIEYNARFGDPEAMNVLPIMKTDFTKVCKAVVEERLDDFELEFEDKATVCKYAVPEGYPSNPVKNVKIEVGDSKARIYYAAVDQREDGLYMTGSRAVAFVGIGDNIAEAEKIAQQAVSDVKGPVFFREDIGTERLLNKRIEHMKQLI
ncbi:phosphoribosylamine--glycine ligase [Candidatus Woesearchaeota archaeon]|nr:phosphoribosylamine--glycine ligase [Candidatus Woesearchaeota archaeon]